jgi:hypothetical protein
MAPFEAISPYGRDRLGFMAQLLRHSNQSEK